MRRRLRRWGRKAALLVLELVVVVTVAAVVYDVATASRIKPATSLYPGPFVRLDGTLVAYRRWGDRGSPVVLLSGFIEPSVVWSGVGERLARDHRIFALDLPPFGYTERRGPYTLRRWVTLVHDFVARFALVHPLVVGHSLGAAVAVGDALWHPGEARGIVLLDGDALSGGAAPGWVGHLLVGPWVTAVYRIVTGADWIFRRGLAGAYPHHPPFTHAFLREWERPFKVDGTLDAFRSMLRYGIQGFRIADLRRAHAHALVVWGAEDTVDSVPAGRRTAKALGVPFELLRGAGHLSMLGAPGPLARTLDAFAARLAHT
jgi:pimeloyl-ACP methyl ester carboxylesterase